MKPVVATIVITSLLFVSGAATAHQRKAMKSYASQSAAMSNVVCVGLGNVHGRVLAGGRDPDPFIRNSLIREYAFVNAYPGKIRAGASHCEGAR